MIKPARKRNIAKARSFDSPPVGGLPRMTRGLITIEEFIDRAGKAGYRFGKGDPKNRLRYLTKMEVLPHAIRLQTKDSDAHTTGYYPKTAIPLLLAQQELKKEDKLSVKKVSQRVKPLKKLVEAAGRGALQESLVTTTDQERLRSTALKFLAPRQTWLGPRLTGLMPALAGAAVFLIVLSQTVFGKVLTEKMVGGLRSALFPEEALQQLVKEAEGLEGKEGREGKVLAEEDLKGSDLPKDLILSVSPNLLKNPSFESAGATAPAAFWQFHPNSTDGNTQRSSHTTHSGSYSLLLSDKNCVNTGNDISHERLNLSCVLGVIQEATRTGANRNYTLGVWIKVLEEPKGPTLPRQGRTLSDTRIHLSLGPGWDKEFDIDSGSAAGMTKVSSE